MRVLIVILILVLLVGCASRYRITLTNDSIITSRNRPRLNENQSAYEFKDAHGQPTSIPVFRVKKIEPL